jgi:hypothetical protein
MCKIFFEEIHDLVRVSVIRKDPVPDLRTLKTPYKGNILKDQGAYPALRPAL